MPDVKISYEDDFFKLCNAARHGDEESVYQILKQKQVNPNQYSIYGETPLYVAAKYGSDSVVKVLLAHGADPNILTRAGDTPLCVAVEQKQHYVVEALLEDHRTDPNLEREDGRFLYISRLNTAIQRW